MSPPPTGPALTPEARHLAREMSALRQRTGLSLAALSGRTTASKSSWHRYLNGTKLPPAGLVRELCELAGEPPERLLALWELAQAAASQGWTAPAPAGGRTGTAPRTATPDTAGSTTGRASRWPRWSAAAAVVLVTGAAVATGAWFLAREGEDTGEVPAEVTGEPSPETVDPRCEGEACAGLDPDRQACTLPGAGIVTVAQDRLPDGTGMEIRYSEKCGAGWGRIWASEVGDRVEVSAPGRDTLHAEVRDKHDAGGYVYTAMVVAEPDELTACLTRESQPEQHCIAAGT